VLRVRPHGELDVGENITALLEVEEVMEKEESNDSADTAMFYISSASDSGPIGSRTASK
jgi:hypothetical protein